MVLDDLGLVVNIVYVDSGDIDIRGAGVEPLPASRGLGGALAGDV